jgi:uncharacterized protein (TIGR00266 family)
MSQWYFTADGEERGPLDQGAAVQFARACPGARVWRAGFADWRAVADAPELQEGSASPSMLRPPEVGCRGGRSRADRVDYTINGEEMQYVEIELDPGESAIAEAGALMHKDAAIGMTTIFGDGSGQDDGLLDRLLGAGRRVLTGENLFTTVFTHSGQGKARIAFAGPFPGRIVAIHLAEIGGRLICQKDSFLAAAKGVAIGIHLQRRILTGLFGGQGFVMQKLEGDGWVFVHVGGTLAKRDLRPGEVLHVDTGCLAALTESVSFDITQAGGIKTMLLGGEGLFLARLRGPGTVWLQSLPFSRLAGRMLAAMPNQGRPCRET